MTSILFVCLGNICRSPLAEGVMRATLVRRGAPPGLLLDSAGTGRWHQGDPPDPRSIAVGQRHGVDISGQRARKIVASDFDRHNLILAMDRANRDDLLRIAPPSLRGRVHLYLEFATGRVADVPDPYHINDEAFEKVYRMIAGASERLCDRLGWPPSGQASSIT